LNLRIDLFLSSHPLWRTLIEKAPENVTYDVWSGFRGKLYLSLTSIFPRKKLIHFCNGVKRAYNRIWVADMESAKVFFKSYSLMEDPDSITAAQERLETGECKALLPLTESALKTLKRFFNIKRFYVKVIYPTFFTKIKATSPARRDLIVFIGGSHVNKSFEAKGGREVLLAWLELHRMYRDHKLLMITTPSREYQKIASELRNVQVVSFMPRETILSEVYPRSRVILLPSMIDTVGYSVIEAMNYGVVPIVSDHFAFPEIVADAGLIVRAPIKLWKEDGAPNLHFYEELSEGPFEEMTEKITKALHTLLCDEDIWREYSQKAQRRITNPPFNIEFRNKQLKEVYEAAIS